MNIKEIIDELLLEVSVYHPIPNLKVKEHVDTLIMICEGSKYAYLIPSIKASLLVEAPTATPLKTPTQNVKSQAEKLGVVHLGRGYYGKKEGQPATHKKDDSGKIVELDPEEKAKMDATEKDTRPVPPKSSATKPTPSEPAPTTNGTQPPVVPPQPISPEEAARIEKEKKEHDDAKNDPDSVLSDPTASSRSQSVARAQKTVNDIDAIEKQKAEKEAENKAKQEDQKNTVDASEITAEMPEANSETFGTDSDILDTVDPNEIRKFNTNIKKVGEMVSAAKSKGEPVPDINLCTITVPGTNLYCDDNLGIPREQMPQFKGKPVAGSRADKMQLDKSGEVDTEPIFKEMLKQKNIKVLNTKVPADKLKATQSELVGAKVVGMMDMLEKDPENEAITAPIYVSRDGFVIDGHHRWAAVVAYNAKHPEKHIPMKTTVIDMDIKDAIPMANKFAEDMGIAVKKADANKEAPIAQPANPSTPNVPTTSQKTESFSYAKYKGIVDDITNNILTELIGEAGTQPPAYNDHPVYDDVITYTDSKNKKRHATVRTILQTGPEHPAYSQVKYLVDDPTSADKKRNPSSKPAPGSANQAAIDRAKGDDSTSSASGNRSTTGHASIDTKSGHSKSTDATAKSSASNPEYTHKSEIMQGLISTEYKMLGDTPVRQLIDESGNVIDVSTEKGRQSAINTINAKLKKFDKPIKAAIANYKQKTSQKWLGEVGELNALLEVLSTGAEGYLLTDSERKNDIAYTNIDGDQGELYMGFISVKTTKGEGAVNTRGANCKSDLEKLCSHGDETAKIVIGGKPYNVKPANVMGSLIDIKSGLFKNYSIQDDTEKVMVNNEEAKLTRYNSKKHGNVSANDLIKASNGKLYFKSQSAYLRNIHITKADVAKFMDDAVNSKLYTNLSAPAKGSPNTISDDNERAQTKEYIKQMLLSDMGRKSPYSLHDLHESMFYIIGNMVEVAHIPVAATGDILAVHYNEGSSKPKCGIITQEQANIPVQKLLAEWAKIKDPREKAIFMSTRVLAIDSRTRALEGPGGKLYYDGIDNSQPVEGTKAQKEISVPERMTSHSTKKEEISSAHSLSPDIKMKIASKLKELAKKKRLSETSYTTGIESDGEPPTGHIPDGKIRTLDLGKPESWFTQGSYKQMSKPKADSMRGTGKGKDTESQFRRIAYKVQNVQSSTLKPAESPKGVDKWVHVKDGKPVKPGNTVRYYDLEDNPDADKKISPKKKK